MLAELRKKFPELFEEDLPDERELIKEQDEAYRQMLKLKMDELNMLKTVFKEALDQPFISDQNGNQIENPAIAPFKKVLAEYQQISNEYSEFMSLRKFDRSSQDIGAPKKPQGVYAKGANGEDILLKDEDIEQMLGNPLKAQEYLNQFDEEELDPENPEGLYSVLSQMLGGQFVDEYLGEGFNAVRAERQATERPTEPVRALEPTQVPSPKTSVYERTLDTIKGLMGSQTIASGVVGGAQDASNIVEETANQARRNREGELRNGTIS